MSSEAHSATSSLAAARAAAKRALLDSPAGPYARRAGELVASRAARRDRRDNEALRLLIAATLTRDASAIDVGANEGRVLADLVRVAPQGRHIAYEPIPGLAAELASRFPDVDVRRAALADEEGEAEFTHVKSRPGYSGLRERDYPGKEELERIRVRIERLDDTLPDGFAPAFLKVDVEGAELGVFRGGIETISRHKPVVQFEHGKGGAAAYGTTPGDVYELLVEQAGLRLYDMDGEGPYSRAQLEETYELGSRWNFFARA